MKNHNARVNFRVTKELHEGLIEMAAEKNITLSELVRQLLVQSLEEESGNE